MREKQIRDSKIAQITFNAIKKWNTEENKEALFIFLLIFPVFANAYMIIDIIRTVVTW